MTHPKVWIKPRIEVSLIKLAQASTHSRSDSSSLQHAS